MRFPAQKVGDSAFRQSFNPVRILMFNIAPIKTALYSGNCKEHAIRLDIKSDSDK